MQLCSERIDLKHKLSRKKKKIVRQVDAAHAICLTCLHFAFVAWTALHLFLGRNVGRMTRRGKSASHRVAQIDARAASRKGERNERKRKTE